MQRSKYISTTDVENSNSEYAKSKVHHTTDVKNNYSVKTLEVLGFFFFLIF